MATELREEPIRDALEAHAAMSSAFEVTAVLELQDDALTLPRDARPVDEPWIKDYDTDGGPRRWAGRFDLTNWGLISAWREAERVGGAVIATDTPGLDMLRGRDDLAVLWDIRIAPDHRRSGVGSMLITAVETWAAARGCLELEIETQHINVAACRFYARHGYALTAIARHAYPEFPDEIQLLWRKSLTG